jgi:hypothetical protein
MDCEKNEINKRYFPVELTASCSGDIAIYLMHHKGYLRRIRWRNLSHCAAARGNGNGSAYCCGNAPDQQ